GGSKSDRTEPSPVLGDRRSKGAGLLDRRGGKGAVRLLGFESEFFQECEIRLRLGIARGEEFVAVENGIGTREKAEGLELLAHLFASGREADFRLGKGDAGERDHADDLEGIDSL